MTSQPVPHGHPPQQETVTVVLHLPAHPLSVSVARNLVRALGQLIPDDRLDRAEVIMSEVVTNAIRHGCQNGHRDPVEVEISTSGSSLSGRVRDRGPAFARPSPPPRTDQVGGYGLHIVEQLAASWTIHREPLGNEVRFTV